MVSKISGKYADELAKTAAGMTAPGKGLLAADESTGTIGKRFKMIDVENVESNRQAYRELLFNVSKEASQYISGVILYEETLFQKTKAGVDFVKVLNDNGIIPGIKVDKGVVPLEGTDGETTTAGLDGLEERCQKYYAQGARFAKWRAVIKVNKTTLPSTLAVEENARTLARYAAICQKTGLVPIVEPEILVMEGDHNVQRSFDVTVQVLSCVFKALADYNVELERIILKPNMVLPGNDCPSNAECSKKVADLTALALQRTVPPAVKGIMFLSGGQTEDQAAKNLNDINNSSVNPKPWSITFSYGRALQQSALKAWQGKEENVEAGQKAYLEKSKSCYQAALGKLN